MLLGSKKRTRVSDEEYDNRHESEGSFGVSVGSNGKGEETGKVDLKRMRFDLDRDTLSREVPSEPFNSSSESSPKTPSSHSTFTDTTEYTSFSYPYHQIHQQQKQQHYLDNTPLSSPNIHKLHRNPIRISTRSDASSSSSSDLLNPYMNINSVLYLANLARTSHIVNELQDDLGCMEIDERAVDANNNGRRNETSPSLGNVDPNPTGSMGHELGHNLRHQYQGDGYVNEDSSEMVSGYQSINAILREAFLRRHQHIDAQH